MSYYHQDGRRNHGGDDEDDMFVRQDDEGTDDNQHTETTTTTSTSTSRKPTKFTKVFPLLDDNSIPKVAATPRRSTSRTATTTRVVLMSDTHGQHRHVLLPARADVLIHAGDMTLRGEPGTLQDLAHYFVELTRTTKRFQQVILVAGNHDVTLQPEFYNQQQQQQAYAKNMRTKFEYESAVQALKASCTYLEDESCLLWPTNHVHVYGSPWSLEFGVWAFTKPADQMEPLWQVIPKETDVLITHGPPYQRGDETLHCGAVGCPDLLRHVQQRVQPRLHVFGHIHEVAGWVGFDGRTMFCNASNVDLKYRAVHAAVVMDVPHNKDESVRWVQPVSPVNNFDSFLTWLMDDDTKKERYRALAMHLQSLRDDDDSEADNLQELMDWQRPWKALPLLPEVFCALAIHRDEKLQKDLRQAISQLYAESY